MKPSNPALAAVVLSLLGACTTPPPPPPATAPPPVAPTASATAPSTDVPGDPAQTEPEVRRDAIVDHCYWGMLAARLARDAYLSKLAPAEPNARTLPVLLRGEGRPFSFERAARNCTAGIEANKQVPDASADTVAAFAPVANATAEALVQVFACFGADCGKTDAFARVRKLTETLRSGQKDFDAQHDRLGAIVAGRGATRSKRASLLLAEAELTTLFDHARELTALVAANKASDADRQTRVAALEADVEALKATASKGKTEIPKVVVPVAAGLVDVAKKLGSPPLDEAARIELVEAFDTLGEVRLRALSMSILKGGTRAQP